MNRRGYPLWATRAPWAERTRVPDGWELHGVGVRDAGQPGPAHSLTGMRGVTEIERLDSSRSPCYQGSSTSQARARRGSKAGTARPHTSTARCEQTVTACLREEAPSHTTPRRGTGAPTRCPRPGRPCMGHSGLDQTGGGTKVSAKVRIPRRTVRLRAGAGVMGQRLVPGRRQGADPGEEHRWLDLHMQPQRQAPVIPFNVAWASGVFEIQDGFQGLQRWKRGC